MPEFLQKGDWLTKIDLLLAYCHVPIAQAHRPFLRLVYDKEILQMTCLPFGLSSAPQNFAAISNWIADILRSPGIRLVVYLDDFCLASQNRDRLITQTLEAINLLEFLGWKINHDKCILKPCQNSEFLGIQWNTLTNQMSLPKAVYTAVTFRGSYLVSINRD
ncbi:uncharacterized protein LOC122502999 [Leptopilina heterotoma]|uniref:uncharacterized protein LOC122502999 n=1 Tax=Leptopilina heterotoma TaxID=63436 RepID=UPI001CA7EC1C|nr:uncharacterized protein LOC122502999 [Leptopilina heterotoma]